MSSKAQALLQQALSHHQAGRVAPAAALYAQFRALMPRAFEGYHLGGAAALQLGQFEQAENLLARALTLNPRASATHMCLGLAQASRGDRATGAASLEKSVALDPKNFEAWFHSASLCATAGRLEAAAANYRRALEIRPDFADAWSGLGSVCLLLGKADEAVAHQTRALELMPHHPAARRCRGQALQSLHRVDEALADFEKQIATHPGDLEARSYHLFLSNYRHDLPREELFAAHVAFGRAASAQAAPTGANAPIHRTIKAPSSTGNVRVAFLSPDLREHSVAYFLEPLLRHLGRERFEILLYHDHFLEDATSERLRALASLWRNFVGQSAPAVEAQIRADAPDILVDLAGHTGSNRLPLFARRLAPAQIAYLGYPNTSGLAGMDFRLTDEHADPTGDADRFHTERLVRFAPVAWAYAPPGDAPEVGPTPSAHGTPFTFGSFNALSKVNAFTLALWRDVLTAVPGSRLALKSFGLKQEQILPRLTAAGIDLARVQLLPAAARKADHLACYHAIDVALDPFPYHGTTTTCEALWMGVPVISLRGDRHAARVGASLLHAVGHGDLLATSREHYVALARQLASDPEALAARRRRLREDMKNSALLDHAGQSARFGEALLACLHQRLSSPASP